MVLLACPVLAVQGRSPGRQPQEADICPTGLSPTSCGNTESRQTLSFLNPTLQSATGRASGKEAAQQKGRPSSHLSLSNWPSQCINMVLKPLKMPQLPAVQSNTMPVPET